MNDNSNIEIINFETHTDDIFADYLHINDYGMSNLMDKYNWEYLDTCSQIREQEYSTLNLSQSQLSSPSHHCYSENVSLNNSLILSDESERSFYSLDYHNQSMISISKSSNGKSFTCKDCNKTYKSKENLTLHIKNIHLKQKPYNCKYCSAVFSHRNGISFIYLGKTYHERKFHTKYLPHKCDYEECPATFASKSALNYHLKSQHKNGKRFCKSKFERSTPDTTL